MQNVFSKMLLWLQFSTLVVSLSILQCVHAATSSAHLPMEARDDSGSQEEDIISTSYVLPNQIFNNGKPYYASKDPISGQLDFNAKKPAGIEPAVNEVIDPKEKIVLSNSSPNIHDFLNLPVKYSSSKFVYPLVSSSYANLKYQGSNKNYMTNKKPTSVQATQATPTQEYNHQYQFTLPTTTKLTTKIPNPPTTTTTTTTSSATTTTSKKPTKTTTISTTTSVQPTHPSIKTSVATSTSIHTQSKYATVSRKPIPVASTTPVPKTTITSTTRKKFFPTKKYIPTSSTPTTLATPIRFPDQPAQNSTAVPTSPQTTPTQHTRPSSNFPSSSISTSAIKLSSQSTQLPTTFKEKPTPAYPTRTSVPLRSTTRMPSLDPADIYQTLGQKNTLKDNEQKPAMTLTDIFNSLAEEESAIASHNQGNQGFDAQGNLMQPFSPSKPSPFATQGPQNGGTASTRPIPNNAISDQQNAQQYQQTPNHMLSNDQKVISGSQENFSNEYVSYQVQQPNVMQYRPAPGAINNVLISPGQNSASFVLGSQQQVGPNAFGTVEKEPLFGKERPVQYGTVINELPPQQQQQQKQKQQQPQPQQTNAVLQPSHPNANQNNGPLRNQEEPPAPPSPYQQLPLVGGPNLLSGVSGPQQGTQQSNSISEESLQLSFAQSHQQQSQSSIDPNQSNTKELLLQTNIRFPPNEEQPEEQISSSIGAGPPVAPQVNGHAQPLSLQKIQQSNNVVFPNIRDDDESVQIQQHEVVSMNQHKQKLSFPQSPEQQHTPSTHMEPPPPPSSAGTEYKPVMNLPKRPHLNRPHGPPTQFAYNEYTRKPIPGITRPNPDRHLPNILPQFRPNAKLSSGHPISNFNQEPGNIRIPSGVPHKRPVNNPGSPQFAHRRQPLMQQPRYPAHRAADSPPGPMGMSHPIEANRRTYRLPPYGGQNFQYIDRTYGRPPMPYPGFRPNGGERHAPLREPEIYKTITSQALDMPPERMAAFEEEDLVISDPPQPVTPNKHQKIIDESKLEPVVTLQMLQSQKKAFSLPNDDTRAGEIKVPSEMENTEDNMEKPFLQNGLYVVYPMTKNNADTNDRSSLKDVTPAIAQVESATHSEYQNTPFTVVRDQPQEPILTVKNKKPQSLQQQSKTQSLKDKFPYPIEKPDPSYSELSVQNQIASRLVAPRIVHSVYSPGTETPIAVAYTPTESTNLYKKYNQKYSDLNMVGSGIGESQTEDNFSHDFDLRVQNLENNFMAPFYPSISLDTATSAPLNGWSILPPADPETFEKNQINRADIEDVNSNSQDTDRNAETDHFQPELQGGFKPIYPPGYKMAESDENESMHQHEANNHPIALALHMETTPATTSSTSTIAFTTTSSTTRAPITTTSPQTSTIQLKVGTIETSTLNPDSKSTEINKSMETSTNAPQTTPTPTPRKKSTFVTSLEALLFGEDAADIDNESRKQKDKAKIGPRMAPRSGPRNLKLS